MLTRPLTQPLTGPLVRGVGEGGVSSLPANAMAALSSAQSRRVDVLLISDSNGAMSGYGWWGGFQKKLGARFGTYATAANGAGSNGGAGNTPLANGSSVVAPFVTSGAPVAQSALFGGLGLNAYAYLPSGSTQANSASASMFVKNASGGLPIGAALRSHLIWGSFDTGAGSFKMDCRLGYSPFTVIASSALTNTNTAEVSRHRTVLDVPVDAARTGSQLQFGVEYAATNTGPFFGIIHRIENPAKTSGISVSKLTSTAGWTMRDMAADLIAASDATLTTILGEARYLQQQAGQTPIIVIAVNSGMNDRTASVSPSLGPVGSNAPTSDVAYIDNLNAIVARLEGVYTANGWPVTELYWLIFPSHPVSNPDDSNLVAYRAAAKTWAQGKARASCFDFTDYINSDTITANGWYDGGGPQHLTAIGYDGMTALLVNAIP